MIRKRHRDTKRRTPKIRKADAHEETKAGELDRSTQQTGEEQREQGSVYTQEGRGRLLDTGVAHQGGGGEADSQEVTKP